MCKASVYHIPAYTLLAMCKDDKELQLKQKQYAAKTFERKLRYIFEESVSFTRGSVTARFLFLLVVQRLGCQSVR